MFFDWIYATPTWLWGLIVLVVTVTLSCAALVLLRQHFDLQISEENSEASAVVMQTVGTLFSVLLAFVVVAEWQGFGDAEKVVQAEAGHLLNIYSDTRALKGDDGAVLRKLVRDYASHVATEEWAQQMAGKPVNAIPGRLLLERLRTATLALEHEGKSSSIQTEIFRELNDVGNQRRARLVAAQTDAGVPTIIWVITVLGTLLLITCSYTLALSSLRLHLWLVATTATAIVLVFILMLALDQPFRGEVRISNEAFLSVLASRSP